MPRYLCCKHLAQQLHLKWWPSRKPLDLFGMVLFLGWFLELLCTGQELDFIDSCVFFPVQDIMLFTCSRFYHSPLTLFSDFQELLCIVFVLGQELCYLFLACFLQVPDMLLLTVAQLSALCWKLLPSSTLRQRAFPIFLSVLVLHQIVLTFKCEHTVTCCRD